jgi:Protein of unknown function DUF58
MCPYPSIAAEYVPPADSRVQSWWAALTPRGRFFAAAGIGVSAVAIGVGQTDVLRVGILLLALPFASLVAVLRTRFRLSAERQVQPRLVSVGHPATVRLSLSNLARIPSGVLLIQDDLPYPLGNRPRFVVDDVWSRWHRDVTYRVRSDLRGRYTIGPLSVLVTDPFGLVELRHRFEITDTLVVAPQPEQLPVVRLPGEWSGSGETRPRSLAAPGEEDVTVRTYQIGDDMRRVHWRATAHHGTLIVRREEQPWQSRCTILLDTRADGHVGRGTTASFEWAVTAAASISTHLLARGYALRLITGEGGAVSGTWHDVSSGPGAAEGVVLEALAVASTSPTASVGGFGASLAGANAASGLLVAVVGHLRPPEAQAIARLRHGGTPALAIITDVSSWGTAGENVRQERDAAVAALRHSGWRVTTAGRGESAAMVWERLSDTRGALLAVDPHPRGAPPPVLASSADARTPSASVDRAHSHSAGARPAGGVP